MKNIMKKIMLSIILFMLFSIGVKKDIGLKDLIYNNIYSKSISFVKINSFFQSTFGSIFPVKNIIDEDVQVFDEKINYKSINTYKNGYIIELYNNFIPSISDGMVIYIGNKEGYGNTIIVEQQDNINIWYSNIEIDNIRLYDYIKKGDFLGSVKDNKLIMVFQKDEDYLDYKEFI